MADNDLDELEKKKQQLEKELKQIQDELDDSIDQVRHDVSSQLDPKTIIKKYPLPTVGASVLLGYLIGYRRKSNTESSTSSGDFSNALLSEIKRLATRKAVSFATDYLEKVLNKKADEHLSTNSQDGSSE